MPGPIVLIMFVCLDECMQYFPNFIFLTPCMLIVNGYMHNLSRMELCLNVQGWVKFRLFLHNLISHLCGTILHAWPYVFCLV